MYVIAKNGETLAKPEIRYFDRTTYFEPQLMADVFNKYPNPSECVFRITRHGEAQSRDTRYEIRAIGLNTIATYDDILAKFNTSMPKDYEQVVVEYPAFKLSELLMNTGDTTASTANLGEYVATPRVSVPAAINRVDSVMPPVTTVIDNTVSADVDVTAEGVETLDDDDVSF